MQRVLRGEKMREKLKKKEAEKERIMEDNKRHTCRGRKSKVKGK